MKANNNQLEIKIFSPSYKRSKDVKTHKIFPGVIYCVHEFEFAEYKAEGLNCMPLPDKLRGNLSKVRNYILDNYINGVGLMIDDDIEALKIWSLGEDNLPMSKSIEDPEQFVEMGFNLCEEAECKVWGVNIIGDKGSYREYTPLSFTNYVSGSFMGFINNDLRFDVNLPLKEDYDYTLQNLNKYRKLLRINFAFMVKKDHGNLGGCADVRTVIKEREQMKLFQKKWGSKIVKNDLSIKKGSIKQKMYDINPIIKAPIKGV